MFSQLGLARSIEQLMPLGIVALPAGALCLNPIAARLARKRDARRLDTTPSNLKLLQ